MVPSTATVLSLFLSIAVAALLTSSALKQLSVSPASMAVVGNGMTGTWLARLLRESGYAGALTIYEKSTVYGGRCATKAFASGARFDHGAQYYALKSVMEPLHRVWAKSSLVNTWFTEKGVDRMKSPQGISTLAKETTTETDLDVDVKLQHQVAKLERVPSTASSAASWRIHFKDGQAAAEAEVVVLTCPLPQALDILSASGIRYEASLGNIAYAKALVLLYSPTDDAQDAAFRERLQQSGRLSNNNGFYTVVGQDDTTSEPGGKAGDAHTVAAAVGVYAIADQRAKGVSTVPAYSIIMNPTFSEAHYDDADDADVVARVRAEMNTLFDTDSGDSKKAKKEAPAAAAAATDGERFSFAAGGAGDLLFLKRWKYSHPLSTYGEPFVEVDVDVDTATSSRGLKSGKGEEMKKEKNAAKTAGFASGLFLAGDAFGGPSVPGAVASATALAAHIAAAQ